MDVNVSSSNVVSQESQLIKQSQAGNRDAFGQLYERHFDAVYRFVLYRLGNVEDTEDITTQVFLRAWQGIGNYVDKGLPFLAWLYRIGHNLIIDFRRRAKQQLVDLDTQLDLADDALLPERQITKDLQLQDVLRALDELDPLQQEVVTLRFMVGLSHKQVGQIVERSEGAVRLIQYRALKALRGQLDQGQ